LFAIICHQNEKIRVFIVDDHPIMRTGIAALIASSKEMVSVGQAATGEEAVEKHALCRPDVRLIDLRLPGISGVETIRRIRGTSPDARFIVLTMYEGDEGERSNSGCHHGIAAWIDPRLSPLCKGQRMTEKIVCEYIHSTHCSRPTALAGTSKAMRVSGNHGKPAH
jgi:CheY-like chemotaxis protein